jgi:hypothetical protein
MYPMPGPYAEPLFQPAPNGDGGYGGVSRFEFWGGYTLWFNKSQSVPGPLLTTGAPNQGGVLGASSTLVVAGGGTFNYGALSGMQIGWSWWGDQDRRFGFYLDSFYTENSTVSDKFKMTGNGSGGAGSADLPILARPFFDSTFGNTSLVLGGPGVGISSAVVTTSSQTWGIEASSLWNLFRTAPNEKFSLSVDGMIGYKFLELRETLGVSSVTTINGSTSTPVFTINPATGFPILSGLVTTPVVVPVGGVTVTAPGQIAITDRFTTTNLFNGTTVGLRAEARYGMFSLEAVGKVGMGDMHQIVEIGGFTYVQNTTTPTTAGNLGTAYGGLLANSSNIGRFQHDDFTFIPEARLNVGIALTRSLGAYVGYNFMYMDHVVRPGGQISPIVDSTTIPLSANYGNINSVAAHNVVFTQTSYYLMGVNFGMTFKY